MGASDILKNTNQNDLDSARLDRDNRTNPPDFQPGMEDDFGDDFFGGDLSGGGGDFLGGGGSFSGVGQDLGGGWGMPPQSPSQPQTKSAEDKAFEVVGLGAKGLWGFAKVLVTSFKGLTPKFWSVWGTRSAFVGAGFSVFGLVIRLFGLQVGTALLVGGILSTSVGVLVLMLNVESARECTSQYTDEAVDAGLQSPEPDTNFSDFYDGDEEDFEMDDTDGDFEGDFDVDSFNDDLFNVAPIEEVKEPEKPLAPDEALSQLQEMPRGMVTRQYLYEAFTKVLPSIEPDYATVKPISSDNDVFLAWEGYLRESAKLLGVQDENLPELVSLDENLFTIKLCVSRAKGLNVDKLAEEIAKIYSYQDGVFNPSVYATADAVGARCYITVFTGETALISLRDIYSECKDFILNANNYMPVVLGIDQLGKPIVTDFKKLESILVTGMPRSGKSWFVQCILTQLCAFVPPSELNIYIGDPKSGVSDFKSFCLPHVKKFVSGDDNIVATLRNLVKVEAPRRERIIGDAGNVNIWDYKEKYPDVELPIIYLLIDEVVTLAERMDKDTKNEFQSLLLELISRLPALGIRAFLIPHMVKNDILKKTMTDMIPCRVSVLGDAGHIESSLGIKPKDFKYRLSNVGDMAIKLPLVSPVPLFVHGAALTSSNTGNNDLFDYLRRLWNKLEPESTSGSVASVAEEKAFQHELLNGADSDNLDEPVFSNTADSAGLFGLDVSSLNEGSNKEGSSDEEFEDMLDIDDDFFK